MLPTRSARLAATLLLALLFGWTVRACRQDTPLPLPPITPTPLEEVPKTTFPDE